MDSAFGIDHGEVSKAFGRKRQPAQQPPNQVRYTLRQVGQKAAAKGSKVASTRLSLKDVGTATGKGLELGGKHAGRALLVKPGATGAAVVGAAGYGLYRTNGKKKAPKGM